MKKLILLIASLLIVSAFLFAASDPVFSLWNAKTLKVGDKISYAVSITDFNGVPKFEKVDIQVLPSKEKGNMWLKYSISNPLAGTGSMPAVIKNIKGKGRVQLKGKNVLKGTPIRTVKLLINPKSGTIKKVDAPDIFKKPLDLTKGNLKSAGLVSSGNLLFRHIKDPDVKEKVIGLEMVKTPAGVFNCKHIRRNFVKTKKVQNGHFVLVTVSNYQDDIWVSEKGKFIGIVKEKRNVKVVHKFQNTLQPNRDYGRLNKVRTKSIERVLQSFSR